MEEKEATTEDQRKSRTCVELDRWTPETYLSLGNKLLEFVRQELEAQRAVTLEELERLYVVAVVNAVGGNMSQAARLLDIDRRTLYRKMAAWGLRRKVKMESSPWIVDQARTATASVVEAASAE